MDDGMDDLADQSEQEGGPESKDVPPTDEEGNEPKSKKARTSKSAKSATGSDQTKPDADKEKDKALAGQKKSSKKYCRKCKGCGYFFQPIAMGSNSAFCIKDKYKFDQLSRMAKAQNKQKWLQDVKADEEKCAKVLRKYAELTGDDGSGSKRKAHFSQVVANFSGQDFTKSEI